MHFAKTILILSIVIPSADICSQESDSTGSDFAAVPAPEARSGRRDPAGAGVISFASGLVLLPGLGSFYAGNSGHGYRHLSIGLATAGLTLMTVSECLVDSWPRDDGCHYSVVFLGFFGGLVGYVANYVWSISSAVGDANEFNRLHSGPTALKPTLRILSTNANSLGTPPIRRIGLGLSARF